MTETQQDKVLDLSPFRRQIDELDDKIIALLIERAGVIRRVGEAKRQAFPGQCPIRPGREADMVRRVMEKFAGNGFDPAAAAAMWRVLIGSSTAMESPLSLSVYTPDRNDTLYWMAREYFGPTLPVIRQPHIKRVIGDVTDGKASVGIVPTLHDDNAGEWWPLLASAEKNSPKIFAHIPFIYENTPGAIIPAALAIGRVQPEATGDDVSFLALETDYNVSQNRLQTAFTQANMQAQWIAVTTPTPSSRRHLIEVKGFITPESESIQQVSTALGASLLNMLFLGAYATPAMFTASTPVSVAYAPRPAKPQI